MTSYVPGRDRQEIRHWMLPWYLNSGRLAPAVNCGGLQPAEYPERELLQHSVWSLRLLSCWGSRLLWDRTILQGRFAQPFLWNATLHSQSASGPIAAAA